MKFFNRFRLKMINNSKVWNYLLYATGEVILVVIGILLAIRLNDLNNGSVQAKEQIELLKNLEGDLEKDIIRLNMLRGEELVNVDTGNINLRKAIMNSKMALDLSYKQMTPQIADSMLCLKINAGKPLLNTETSVYDQLKSTGKLYNLGSEHLKSKILEYYTRAEREEVYNKNNNAKMQEYDLKCTFLYVLEADRVAQKGHFNLNNYQWLFDTQSSEMKLYRAFLFQNITNQRINYNKMGVLLEMASALQEIIQEEVERKVGHKS